jgi:L-fucose mutarotase/ribose pyranase (RbsD/FucU family)
MDALNHQIHGRHAARGMAHKDGEILVDAHRPPSAADPRRKEAMNLRLSSAKDNVAVFVPVDDAAKANAGDLASVTYSLKDADTLAMRIESKPVKQGEGDGALTKAVTKPVVIDMTLKRAK